MRAVTVSKHGGPDVLGVRDMAEPAVRPGLVRIQIEAAGVSYADLLLRAGAHPAVHPRVPFVPGWDFVGRVEQSGDPHWHPGDRVAGLSVLGGQAEKIVVPGESLVACPEGVDAAAAVCLVMDFVTAWQMLHRSTHVSRGQTVLVHGAAGGVGTAALQLAHLAGLRAFGTARGKQLDDVRELGARAIDFEHEDFVAVVRSEAGGADVVLDAVGGAHLFASMRAAKPSGTVVFFGWMNALHGGRASPGRKLSAWIAAVLAVAYGKLTRRGRFQIYSIQRSARRRPDWFHEDLAKLFELLASGEIQPHVTDRVRLDQVPSAYERLAKGERGKFVILPAAMST